MCKYSSGAQQICTFGRSVDDCIHYVGAVRVAVLVRGLVARAHAAANEKRENAKLYEQLFLLLKHCYYAVYGAIDCQPAVSRERE